MRQQLISKILTTTVAVTILSAVAILAAAEAGSETNALYEQLHSEGVKFGASTIKLPQPTMPDGLKPAAQQAALNSIADDTHPVEALTRKAVVAPFILKIADEKASGAARPRRGSRRM